MRKLRPRNYTSSQVIVSDGASLCTQAERGLWPVNHFTRPLLPGHTSWAHTRKQKQAKAVHLCAINNHILLRQEQFSVVPQKDICERSTQKQTNKKTDLHQSSSCFWIFLWLSTAQSGILNMLPLVCTIFILKVPGFRNQTKPTSLHIPSLRSVLSSDPCPKTGGGGWAEVWEDSTTTQVGLVSLWTAVTVSPLNSCRFSAFPPVRSHSAAAVFFHDTNLRLFLIPE